MSTLSVGTIKSNTSSPPTIQNSSGTEIGTLCRAWVNFNGTGTVAIRESFNVSSITDNGTGLYTVNFSNAMPDTDYSFISTARSETTTDFARIVYSKSTSTKTTSALQIVVGSYNALVDPPEVNVAVFR